MSDKDTPEEHAATLLKGRRGVIRIINATRYSLAGLQAAFRGESAFRQLLLLNAILIPIACLLDVARSERALLILVPMLSLIVELFNSAIEATVDRISLSIHPLSKQAKDMGSAAQLISLLAIVMVWLIILT